MKLFAVLSTLFLTPVFSYGQQYPHHYFTNPLDPPFLLAGTFCEIRPDHFHSGIDLSTSEVEGKPVYAAADGYVSRIKISSVGFGKAIYITHPNGYVTVYGHLKKLSYALENYVLQRQYEKESFEIELFPTSDEFKVKQHEVIAYSGNTGASAGPHLHFEIRDEKTEEPINPQLFGYTIQDDIKPEINLVRIVPARDKGIVVSTDTARTYRVIKSGDGEFVLPSNEHISVYGKIAFEFSVKDLQRKGGASLGIYSLLLKVDSNTIYSYKYDRYNFSDARYVNAHIDYEQRINDDLIFERCYKLEGNHLKFYQDTTGFFNFTDDRDYSIEATVKDFNGNTSILKFQVKGNPSLGKATYHVHVRDFMPVLPSKGITIRKPNVEITIPPKALYETYFFVNGESPKRNGFFSSDYSIGERTVPLHLAITISIKPVELPDSLKYKALIVSFNQKGKIVAEGGQWNGQFLSAKARHFGTFAVAIDTTAPIIELKALSSDGIIRAKISDDLSGIKSYRATLDGKWLLMEYDAKSNLLTGIVEKPSNPSNHHFEIEVIDGRDNESKTSRDFNY